MHSRLRSSFLLCLCASSPLLAANLRVPADYSTIQRAVFAADPGDTIEIEAGTFHEHLWLPKELTLKGKGVGQTTIIGYNRAEPVIYGDGDGAITIHDVSFGHTDEQQSDAYAEAAKFHAAPVSLSNVEVTRSSNNGIEFEACRRVSVRNVSIKQTRDYCLHIRYCDEFLVENVTADAAVKNRFIEVQSSVGLIKNISIEKPHEDFVNVWGASKVRFEAIDEKLRELMDIGEYDDSPPEGEYERTPEEVAEDAEWMRVYEEQRKKTQRVTQTLTRKLQKEAPRGAPKEQVSKALQNHLKEFFEQTDGMGPVVADELRDFSARHGIEALDTLITTFPFRSEEEHKTVQQYYDYHLPKALVQALTEHRARAAINSTFDLPTVLASWKQLDASASPAEAGGAFYDMAQAMSNKAETGSAEEKKVLKEALLKEVAPFIEKHGFPGLDELLSRLTQSALPILVADDVRNQLTPQQKRAFTKFLVQ